MSALAGKRVLNTRPIAQQAELDALLIERGAQPISFPSIAIEPLESTERLDLELRHAAAGGYAWVLITSANTATVLEARLRALDLRINARVAAIGSVTAKAVERWLGQPVAVLPDKQHAVALAAQTPIKPGDCVLIPGSERARPELPQMIAQQGGIPISVAAYRTVSTPAPEGWQLAPGSFDAIAFASPSAIEGFCEQLTQAGLEPGNLAKIAIGCIGPTTHQAAVDNGFIKATQASEYTIEGLVQAVERAITQLEWDEA